MLKPKLNCAALQITEHTKYFEQPNYINNNIKNSFNCVMNECVAVVEPEDTSKNEN